MGDPSISAGLMRRERIAPLVAFGVFGVFWGSWDALLPAVKEAAGVDDGQLGLALLAIGLGALPLMLFAGPLVDRWGRPTVADMLAVFAVTAAIPAFATSWLALTVSLAALGAASGALDVIVNARVAALEGTGTRLMNLAHALFSAGVLLGSVTTGVARRAGTGRLAILGTVAALVMATAGVNRGLRGAPVRVGAALRLLLRPALLILGALCALAFILEGGVERWSAIHLEDTLGASAAVSGLGPGIFAAAMVAGRLAGQATAHRFTPTQLMVSAGLVASAGVGLAAGAPTSEVALAGFAIAGAGVSLAAPTFLGLAPGVVPEAPSTAMSSVTTISYLGFVISPPAVGAVADVAGLRAGLLVLVASGLALAMGTLARARLGGAPE